MKLNERYRKFPIKFYQTEDGIYYENPFMNGKAKDMTDAFNQIKDKNLDHDLYYYYNDVTDIQVGAFEPALYDKKTKNGVYLGKLNLELELNDYEDEHSVKYLSKNPDKITNHEKFIKKLKDTEKRKQFFADLKSGLKKLAGVLQHEMFSPYKTREDLICDHCGEIIPTATYYEEWKKKNYHLECIWDKLCNNNKSNSHENAEEYFLSLEKLLDNWDYSMDCPDDYESDLELYKVNKRLGLTENAAMYKSPLPTFKDFYEQVIENPQNMKKRFFSLFKDTLRVSSDTILHDYNKHKITYEQWEDCLSNFKNIINACSSKKRIQGRKTFLCHIIGYADYGITLVEEPKYFYLTTCFIDNANSIDNWIKSSAQRLTNNPSASLGQDPISVVHVESEPNKIITHIKEKVKI